MTLLDAAKAALNYITNTENELGITLGSGDKLRTAIAEEEAKNEDGTHSCGYFCTRPACVLAQRDELTVTLAKTNTRLIAALKDRNEAQAERDELRAKLAAMESAEPVAWTTLAAGRRFMTPDENERDNWIALGLAVTPLYTHPAPLSAYTPMTEGEIKSRTLYCSGNVEVARIIERAVLARLGVKHG